MKSGDPRLKTAVWQCRSVSFTVLALLIASAVLGGYLILERGRPLGMASSRTPASSPPPPVAVAHAPPQIETGEIVDRFSRNQTFAEALSKRGISNQEVHQLIESARPVYDLAKVASGRPFWLRFTAEGVFHDFRYPVDDERYLTVYRKGEEYVPVIKKFPYEIRIEPVSGIIENSLFLAVKESGEEEQLALDLAEIFMWDIDFYTDIQKGDAFRMLVEKKYLDGRFVKYGPILAADITNQGKTFFGYRFRCEDGTHGYYGPDGIALKKSFLKSPLKFARITSSFSKGRFHPVLRIVRPHLGVDYAAPAGTPVVAVGAGIVASAEIKGGSGKMVMIRHAGGYETLYLHLSRIAVRSGVRIAQGQVIGYVGATGLATGPHLDFRVIERGRYVNPTKVVFPPPPPVPSASLSRFVALRDSFQSQLEQIVAPGLQTAAN